MLRHNCKDLCFSFKQLNSSLKLTFPDGKVFRSQFEDKIMSKCFTTSLEQVDQDTVNPFTSRNRRGDQIENKRSNKKNGERNRQIKEGNKKKKNGKRNSQIEGRGKKKKKGRNSKTKRRNRKESKTTLKRAKKKKKAKQRHNKGKKLKKKRKERKTTTRKTKKKPSGEKLKQCPSNRVPAVCLFNAQKVLNYERFQVPSLQFDNQCQTKNVSKCMVIWRKAMIATLLQVTNYLKQAARLRGHKKINSKFKFHHYTHELNENLTLFSKKGGQERRL